MKRILPFIIILAVLGIALASVWYLTQSIPASTTPPSTASQAPPASQTATQPVINQGVPGAEPARVKGPANAPAHLEEFGDFQCPPCALFHPILEQMEAEFGDKLRVTFRHFPLLPRHQHAFTAAAAAEAAGMQNKFWQMHKLIYEHQKDWNDLADALPTFEDYAEQIGLNMARFRRDMASDDVKERIFRDQRRGQSLGVQGTPTVFLNGREVPFNSLPADALRVLIQREVDAKK